MSKRFIPLFLAGILLCSRGADSAIVYTPDEGWSVEGEPPAQLKSALDQMHRAEGYENAGDNKRALVSYRVLVKKWPKSFYAPKAQLKVAMLSEKLNDLDHAFEAYGLYITKYPRGEDFDQCVESQFRIAKLFLDGAKEKVLGIPVVASMGRAESMFAEIVKNAPFSSYAPLSQFNSGVAMEKQGKYPEAIAAYETLLSKYPSDPVAADAQYQIGYVRLKAMREGSYDEASSTKAREAFEDFIERYPNSEKVPQAKENLVALGGHQTENTFGIAKFYDKKKDYKAAVIYYNEVIKEQPGSRESLQSKARIDALKSKVGEDALSPAPAQVQTGPQVQETRKLQAKVNTASRPDYLGPPVAVPVPEEVAPPKPKVRTSPMDLAPLPAVEPALPSQ